MVGESSCFSTCEWYDPEITFGGKDDGLVVEGWLAVVAGGLGECGKADAKEERREDDFWEVEHGGKLV